MNSGQNVEVLGDITDRLSERDEMVYGSSELHLSSTIEIVCLEQRS